MKFIFFMLSFFLVITSVWAQDLTCSSNGTFIWHIPGAFTSQNNQDDAEKGIRSILVAKPNYFDLKSQDVKTIKIASQGLIQDKFNYVMNSVGEKYGQEYQDMSWVALGSVEYGFRLGMAVNTYSNGGDIIARTANVLKSGVKGSEKLRAVSNLGGYIRSTTSLVGQGVRNINTVENDGSVMRNLTTSPTGFGLTGKMIGATGILGLITGGSSLVVMNASLALKSALNFVSVLALERDMDKALTQDQDVLAAYYVTQDNVNNIAKAIREKLELNQKVILSAHGEGNQLASRAIAQIQSVGTVEQRNKLSKYVSVLATSPTTDAYTNKYDYMKNDNDVRLFGGSGVGYNYVLKYDYKSMPLTDAIVISSHSASNFLDYYISEVQQGKKNTSATYQSMRDNFIENLRARSESLQDNCAYSYLQIPTTTDRITYNFSLSSEAPDLIYKWDFGDGSPIETTTSQNVTHTFPLDVTKYFQVTLTTIDSYGNSTTEKTSVDVVVPSSLKIIEGSTSYKFLRLVKDDAIDYFGRPMGPTYAGLLHKRTGSLMANGPVGTYFSMTGNYGEITSFDCGGWSRVNSSDYGPGCERASGAPYGTTFYLKKVDQCGGEGCLPLPLLSAGSNNGHGNYYLYIPFNIDDVLNAPEFHYVGEMPAAFDF